MQGIFRASFGSNRVHNLVIHPEDFEAELVTTDSVINSPSLYPTTPSDFESGNSQQSYIKQQSYTVFRTQSVAPHWIRLPDLSPTSYNSKASPSSIVDLDDLPRTLGSFMSSVLSSDISHETDTESPYSPADNKWHSEDSAVLTCGYEAYDAQVCGDDAKGCIGLGMRVASSTQSTWD